MTESTLYLARHGQSAWNQRKLITGQLDPPLAPGGKEQARLLAQLLRRVPLKAIYASTLARSRETALEVGRDQGLPVQELTELREMHFGSLQGRFRDERDPEAAASWRARKADPVQFRPPGGETFTELIARVKSALGHILAAHPAGAVLLVGHRNTNRAVLATLLGWSPAAAVRAVISHRSVYRIQLGNPPIVHTIRLEREAPDALSMELRS